MTLQDLVNFGRLTAARGLDNLYIPILMPKETFDKEFEFLKLKEGTNPPTFEKFLLENYTAYALLNHAGFAFYFIDPKAL